MLEPEIEEYLRYSPFLAVVYEKDDDERWIMCFRFSQLSDSSRELLTSPDTADLIKSWETRGLIPPTHSFAITKLIGLVALDDLPTDRIAELLGKLGIPEVNSAELAAKIINLMQPVLTERAAISLPENMASVELPPMTRPMENGPRPLTPSVPKANVPERNIIDLRNKN